MREKTTRCQLDIKRRAQASEPPRLPMRHRHHMPASKTGGRDNASEICRVGLLRFRSIAIALVVLLGIGAVNIHTPAAHAQDTGSGNPTSPNNAGQVDSRGDQQPLSDQAPSQMSDDNEGSSARLIAALSLAALVAVMMAIGLTRIGKPHARPSPPRPSV